MKIMTADLKREQYQSTSSHQEDSRASIDLVTPQEAKERGLKFRIQPPQTQICKYCGKEVYPTGVVIQGMVFLWKPTLRCKCEKALAYWKAYDQRQAAEKAAQKEEEEQRARRERIDRLIGMSGIKKRFQQRTFPNFVTDTQGRKRSYQTAKEYADNFAQHKAQGDGLYIEGTNGTGKTHLAAAIALQLINEGIPVICKTANDLLLDIKKAYDDVGTTENQILDAYRDVDLLIVDDLGKEQCSEWSMSILYTILNDRYEAMKPTIITTNYNADELVKTLTPKGSDSKKAVAIISRLKETSAVLTMAWEDCRSK